ncbi:MAG TPA: TonB family protein [Bacteroidia bacterium]|nr:TonB family protein [Bacteroidota bacterium]MBL0051609.1 TonB family protein [Bacteroidota bacterium]HRC32773.1 TonB family protein [Bacteroidia bacterium]
MILFIVILILIAFILVDVFTTKVSLYDKLWTDNVFAGKNKNYGAYYLRSLGGKHVMRGTLISVILFSVGLGAPIIAKYLGNFADGMKDKVTEVTTLEAPPPIDKTEPPPPPPEAPPPPPLKSTVKFVAPEIVKDEEVKDEPPPTVEELKDVDVGKKTEEGDPGGVDNSLIDEGPAVIEETPQIFTIVEQMPEFPGGEESLIKFIQSNFRYPAMERENNIQGTVYLTFVVRPDGEIADIKVMRGVAGGPNLEKEAIRLVKAMPKWKAGKQNGKQVSVQFNLPVKCQLKG